MAVELISEIVQKGGQDFALVDANNIRGGFYQVTEMSERDAIPDKRKKNGMLCFVLKDPDKVFTYQWLNGYWIKAQLGGGGGGDGDTRVEIVSTPEELANRVDLERAGQIVYVESTDEVAFWSNKNKWSSFDHIRIQDTEPVDDDAVWIDTSQNHFLNIPIQIWLLY